MLSFRDADQVEIAAERPSFIDLMSESTEVDDQDSEHQLSARSPPSPSLTIPTSSSSSSVLSTPTVGAAVSTTTKTTTASEVRLSKTGKRSLDPVESAIIDSLQQAKNTKQDLDSDEDGLLGRQVAATLRRFTPHQKAIAKLRFQ